jgi:hypothetical protein
MNQKGLIKILGIGIVIVLVIVIGGYFLSTKLTKNINKTAEQSFVKEEPEINNKNQDVGEETIKKQDLNIKSCFEFPIDYNNDGHKDCMGENNDIYIYNLETKQYVRSDEFSEVLEIAKNYCSEYKYDGYSGFYLDADLDTDKEIFAWCEINVIAVLDKKEGEWEQIMEHPFRYQNDYVVTGIDAKDYNNDGIDEITYSFTASNMTAGEDAYYLYSFQDKKWFTCFNYWEANEDGYWTKEGLKCGEYLYDEYGNETEEFKDNKNNSWVYSEDKKTWSRSVFTK